MSLRVFSIAALVLLSSGVARAAEWTVQPVMVADEKAVYATVESENVVPARARIGGTIASIEVKRGDAVDAGQVLATVVDEKIALQLNSLDAQIKGLKAQLDQAKITLSRIERLRTSGTASKAQLDNARTEYNVAETSLNARIAQRSVIAQQAKEGAVRAPAAGRVLDVPVTAGTVVLAGETVAKIADRAYMLRLRVPERYARFLEVGDAVRVAGSDLGTGVASTGEITLVYPEIEDGRVVADARLGGLGDYFVGERVRVWLAAGEREAIAVPASYLTTRFGVDYVRLKTKTGVMDAPVQRGRPVVVDGKERIEILSGLHAGDVLVQP
jgi:RND family efflux transporter MFP subunit